MFGHNLIMLFNVNSPVSDWHRSPAHSDSPALLVGCGFLGTVTITACEDASE